MGIYVARRGGDLGRLQWRLGLALPAFVGSLPVHTGSAFFAMGLSNHEGFGTVLRGHSD